MKKKYKWDVFISHASEDKEEFVLPLEKKLIENGVKVWIDNQELIMGDSIKRRIEEGLMNSKYGIVVLSDNFFKKEWPQKELDALFSKEIEGKKVILPIWYNVSASFVKENSILLADKYAVNSEKGLDLIIDEILKVIGIREKRIINSFSVKEINAIEEAIRYYRARAGNFYSDDPILSISLSNRNKNRRIRLCQYKEYEIALLLKVINENIIFLNEYKYKGLTEDNAISNKQAILMPLFDARNKLVDEIELRKRN